MQHPPYSPKLVAYNFFLFSKLYIHLKSVSWVCERHQKKYDTATSQYIRRWIWEVPWPEKNLLEPVCWKARGSFWRKLMFNLLFISSLVNTASILMLFEHISYFIVISTTFWLICPPAFFRCLSNSGTVEDKTP